MMAFGFLVLKVLDVCRISQKFITWRAKIYFVVFLKAKAWIKVNQFPFRRLILKFCGRPGFEDVSAENSFFVKISTSIDSDKLVAEHTWVIAIAGILGLLQ